MKTYKDTDTYINSFPKGTQKLLGELRAVIRKALPKAEESISYGMPAYKQNGPVVYFGGYEKHIGFYPTPSGITAFKKELAHYKMSKGAVQFPLNKPLPLALITKITKFKLKENLAKSKVK